MQKGMSFAQIWLDIANNTNCRNSMQMLTWMRASPAEWVPPDQSRIGHTAPTYGHGSLSPPGAVPAGAAQDQGDQIGHSHLCNTDEDGWSLVTSRLNRPMHRNETWITDWMDPNIKHTKCKLVERWLMQNGLKCKHLGAILSRITTVHYTIV